MKRKKRKEEMERRLQILDEIDILLRLDESGWNADQELADCGDRLLGESNRPGYLPEDMSRAELSKYLKIARKNDVPPRVFKDRLRRGKTPDEAATKPYFNKNE